MRVRRVEVDGPGFRRRRAGKGFTYLDCDGARITDADVLDRVKALAVPPAWKDVWICPDPRGHIQAVGLDDRGRRQYRYHDGWRERQEEAKHDRMLEMARALPHLRRRVRHDLAAEGLGRDRVLASAVRLLQLGLFRVGGESYAEDNGSYGLATLCKAHVRVSGDEMRFDYPGKSGQRRVVTVEDGPVAAVVRALKRRRRGGTELLAYKDERGHWVDVRSADINDYLRDALDSDVTAKDFRTWTATVLAAVGLATEQEAGSDRQRRSAVLRVVRSVARQLGNTPAVARGSYVDPRVIERFEAGHTVDDEVGRGTDVEAMADDLGVAGTDGADDGAGDAGSGDGDGPGDEVTVEAVPADLLAEIETAVVDLIEASRRQRRPTRQD